MGSSVTKWLRTWPQRSVLKTIKTEWILQQKKLEKFWAATKIPSKTSKNFHQMVNDLITIGWIHSVDQNYLFSNLVFQLDIKNLQTVFSTLATVLCDWSAGPRNDKDITDIFCEPNSWTPVPLVKISKKCETSWISWRDLCSPRFRWRSC